MTISGDSLFDPLLGGGVALWMIASTLREVAISRDELISPQKIACGHASEANSADPMR